MIAKLPIYLYRETPDGPLEVTDHPGIRCIGGIPSELHTTFELRQLMEVSKGLGGNGYARVYRDPFGAPRAIQWLNPNDVTPRKVMRPNGECYISYEVKGTKDILTRHDILHVRGISRDGIEGVSPIRMLRESIGTCLAQTEAAGKLMREGTHFPGYLVAPQALSSKQMEDARTEWDRNTAGAKNAGRVPIMHGGFDFKQTNGMSMVDAEFLGSRRFELQEIARLSSRKADRLKIFCRQPRAKVLRLLAKQIRALKQQRDLEQFLFLRRKFGLMCEDRDKLVGVIILRANLLCLGKSRHEKGKSVHSPADRTPRACTFLQFCYKLGQQTYPVITASKYQLATSDQRPIAARRAVDCA
jgi:hypothetical protein